MGAKQSKRSVDISGKEAEGGGEVAAAGAGGEGRVEQLADADALKPQLNGDAHIQHEQTDKEKELNSGTPENEKDTTTEKEGKEDDDKDKEAAPVSNGESEPKVENGESAPVPEDGKKPKKEKVKKKWSLRSISFSRKDKPKQEKKQKDEEPKTNGEPEKVPEETAAEATPETANEVAEEATASAEEKDEKTPETPVTEPLTNGTSTPDSAVVAPAPAAAPEPQPEPEQLPVNGLSLEEPKQETPEVEKPEETKPEPPATETAEIVPAPEIPKEVCVEQMPLLEPTPPPLPANPPPSSVASFAATTMAPELTDASLANTADAAIAPLSALSETKDFIQPESPTAVTVTETNLENELAPILKETSEDTTVATLNNEPEIKEGALRATIVVDVNVPKQVDEIRVIDTETMAKESSEIIIETAVTEVPETVIEPIQDEFAAVESANSGALETETIETPEIIEKPAVIATPEAKFVKVETLEDDSVKIEGSKVEPTVIETIISTSETTKTEEVEISPITETVVTESENIPEPELDVSESDDSSLPPPPVQDDSITNLDEVDEKVEESLKQIPEPITEAIIESSHNSKIEMTNGVHDISPDETVDTEKLKKIAKPTLGSAVENIEGNAGVEVAATDGQLIPAEDAVSEEAPLQNGDGATQSPPAAPLPPPPTACRSASPATEAAAPHTPQEPLAVSDKLADLIPEVPDVPELNTETLQETVTDVAVAN